MISLNKLLRISLFFSLVAVCFLGCDKEPKTKNFVARVNNSFLTEKDILEIDSLYGNAIARNEIIKRWIDNELLFQEAEREGITNDENFIRIIKNARRELAAVMLKKKHLERELKEPNSGELSEFYEKHKDEFYAFDDMYVYDLAVFNNETFAIKFRSKAFEIGWDKTVETFSNDKSMIQLLNNAAFTMSQIYPIKLLRLIQGLNPGEISIILEQNPKKFYLVRLNQVFRKGNILPLEVVEDRVKKRFIAKKQEEILQEYLEELYSENEVEIKEK